MQNPNEGATAAMAEKLAAFRAARAPQPSENAPSTTIAVTPRVPAASGVELATAGMLRRDGLWYAVEATLEGVDLDSREPQLVRCTVRAVAPGDVRQIALSRMKQMVIARTEPR